MLHRSLFPGAVLLVLLLSARPLAAQPAAPLQEFRGVWLTTAAALDWPRTSGAASQERDLRNIIRQSAEMGLNTIVFQAVARGDAMYPSIRLPWAPWLTGSPGEDPGWNPLAVAVEEAHSLGMELHAWFNVYRIGNASTPRSMTREPLHVTYAHPEWVQTEVVNGQDNFWLNPAYRDATQWLIGNVLEIVENYDVDAIHFDFMRYPQGGFASDPLTFVTENPNNIDNVEDWRRDNINEFVREVFFAVQDLKPWVKVGATPIGRYEGETGDFVGYAGVYQASRDWLAEGIHDYLAPQIYWDIANWPHFDELSQEWVSGASGRHIYTGVAAYRPEVLVEIPEQIDAARTAGAAGQVYFRYAHITPPPFADRYDTLAIRPRLAYRFEASRPSAPADVSVSLAAENTVAISWSSPEFSLLDPAGGYALFRAQGRVPDVTGPGDLRVLLGPDARTFTEQFDLLPVETFYYQLVAVSRLGMVSDPSPVVSTADVVATHPPPTVTRSRILAHYPNPTSTNLIVEYEIAASRMAMLRIVDLLGREVAVLARGHHEAGNHRLEWNSTRLPGGVYLLELSSGGSRHVARLVIAR